MSDAKTPLVEAIEGVIRLRDAAMQAGSQGEHSAKMGELLLAAGRLKRAFQGISEPKS